MDDHCHVIDSLTGRLKALLKQIKWQTNKNKWITFSRNIRIVVIHFRTFIPITPPQTSLRPYVSITETCLLFPIIFLVIVHDAV